MKTKRVSRAITYLVIMLGIFVLGGCKSDFVLDGNWVGCYSDDDIELTIDGDKALMDIRKI